MAIQFVRLALAARNVAQGAAHIAKAKGAIDLASQAAKLAEIMRDINDNIQVDDDDVSPQDFLKPQKGPTPEEETKQKEPENFSEDEAEREPKEDCPEEQREAQEFVREGAGAEAPGEEDDAGWFREPGEQAEEARDLNFQPDPDAEAEIVEADREDRNAEPEPESTPNNDYKSIPSPDQSPDDSEEFDAESGEVAEVWGLDDFDPFQISAGEEFTDDENWNLDNASYDFSEDDGFSDQDFIEDDPEFASDQEGQSNYEELYQTSSTVGQRFDSFQTDQDDMLDNSHWRGI